MKIALILFAYNRPKYLRKTIKTHVVPSGIDTFAFIDYSETQKEIYKIIDKANLYKTIFKRPENLGLNESIKRGIQHIFNLGYDAVIVLEDDLLLSDDAIMWLEENLHYCDTVFLQEPTEEHPFKCWGWAMWESTWALIDWEISPKVKNRNSWDCIINENFRVNEYVGLGSKKPRVKHIGAKGVHYNLIGYLKEKIWAYTGTH